jgi:hypothetical protein
MGERQWPVRTKMFEFTGIASCCPTGLSSYWLMCLHRDSNWHPVTGHANWQRVIGPSLCTGLTLPFIVAMCTVLEQTEPMSIKLLRNQSKKSATRMAILSSPLYSGTAITLKLATQKNPSLHTHSTPMLCVLTVHKTNNEPEKLRENFHITIYSNL